MTTAAENERLGVLESEVAHIKGDVAEIKTDVKSLIASQQSVAVELAAKRAADDAVNRTQATTGIWVRFISERALALVAIVISIIVALAK